MVPNPRVVGQLAGVRFPIDDRRLRPEPLLTQPWQGGMTGWVVVFCAVIAELVGGAVVANQTSATVALLVLIIPVLVAFGFAVVQWWQVRSSGTEPASWWHLGGVAAAALTWILWPTVPGALTASGVGSASGGKPFCDALPATEVPGCLHRAAQAADGHNLAWWAALAVIVIAALLARRSRIAAWSAIPAAFAGGQLAAFFLNQFVLYYHLS